MHPGERLVGRDNLGPMTESAEERPATGVPAVDAVIASVDALVERPIEEHAEVFGAAHDRLRRALDDVESDDSVG